MASFNARQVISNLKKKGFIQSEGHHHFYEFWHNGKMVSKTRTSHDGEDINDYLIKSMAKQCKMPNPFFKEFVQCTKSQEDYELHLQQSGYL